MSTLYNSWGGGDVQRGGGGGGGVLLVKNITAAAASLFSLHADVGHAVDLRQLLTVQ